MNLKFIKNLKLPKLSPATIDGLDLETKRSKHIVRITGGLLIVFVIWAWLAELDQVTRAPAQVIASSRSQVIQALDGGILQSLRVKEGDTVEAGQLLASLDRAKLEAAYFEIRAKTVALQLNLQRLQAELHGSSIEFGAESDRYPKFRANQEALIKKRQMAIQEEISSLQRMHDLAKQELEMTEPLLKTGDVSRSDVLRLQRQVADLSAQISNRRNKYLQDTQAELNKTQEELAAGIQILAQRKESLDSSEFKSPMRGIVKNIRVTTIGGVLRPGEELMQIVPLDDDLLIEAKVRPADIGFLRIGQPASVKIDAYDYTVFGSLDGKLIYISPDTLKEEVARQGAEQEYYRVQIQVQKQELQKNRRKQIEIQPGMTATAEIKTGTNSVLSYLTKPVTKTFSESMGER
jgi:membrane fusion protein, adhesin transport system